MLAILERALPFSELHLVRHRLCLIKNRRKKYPRWWRSKWKLHKSPPKTNLELQVNCRDIILNNQLERSLINMAKQKKTLQHDVTGKECGGDARRLARIPQVAAGMSGDISTANSFPLRSVGSKPQAGLPSLQH